MNRPFLHAAVPMVPALALASLLGGCMNNFSPPWLVERTRIVAARVSVDADDTLAWPSPGDAVHVDWVVLTPAAPEPVAATFIACAPLPGSRGGPACIPGSLVVLPPRAPGVEPLVTALTVPGVDALSGATSLLVVGAVCAGGGTPAIMGPSLTTPPECEGGSEPRTADLVTLSIPLVTDPALANRHPSVREEDWTLDGQPWAAFEGELPYENCAARTPDGSLPRLTITVDRKPVVTIGWSEDDRETYTTVTGDPPAPVTRDEVLQYSHFTTAGKLSRANSAIDDTVASGAPATVDWTFPLAEDVPPEGLLVRMSVVVRDGRGGVDRAERAVCVVR